MNGKSELQNTLILFKNYLNTLFFVFINFTKSFCEYIRMENQGNNNENIESKYLQNMQNKTYLKIKKSFLELEKDFIGLNGRELKDREEKN